MKTRLFTLLALLATGLAITAVPASAQRPIPGIKQTQAYTSLKNYVNFLQGRKTVPANDTKRQRFKTTLANRKRNANTKVVALFSQKLNRISKQDDNQERRAVKAIRTQQKNQVQSIKQDQAERIDDLQADQNAAVQRVFDNYAPRINPKANRRDALKRQLARTTNPSRRAALTKQIDKLQTQLNALVSDRTTEVNSVNARYVARINSVNNLYNSRIANVKASAQRQITQARNAYRQTYRSQIAAAKTRRDAQKQLVGALADRGSGYIEQMPPAGV